MSEPDSHGSHEDVKQCPICYQALESHGEEFRTFGLAAPHPVAFGDIVSLECGHRIHRDCLLEYANVAGMHFTCPVCRGRTSWNPPVEEVDNMRALMQRGWKTLNDTERRVLQWTWITVLVLTFMDPIGFSVISALLLALTPPLMYPEMIATLTSLRLTVVKGKPGQLLSIGITAGCLVTGGVLVHNSAR